MSYWKISSDPQSNIKNGCVVTQVFDSFPTSNLSFSPCAYLNFQRLPIETRCEENNIETSFCKNSLTKFIVNHNICVLIFLHKIPQNFKNIQKTF